MAVQSAADEGAGRASRTASVSAEATAPMRAMILFNRVI